MEGKVSAENITDLKTFLIYKQRSFNFLQKFSGRQLEAISQQKVCYIFYNIILYNHIVIIEWTVRVWAGHQALNHLFCVSTCNPGAEHTRKWEFIILCTALH